MEVQLCLDEMVPDLPGVVNVFKPVTESVCPIR